MRIDRRKFPFRRRDGVARVSAGFRGGLHLIGTPTERCKSCPGGATSSEGPSRARHVVADTSESLARRAPVPRKPSPARRCSPTGTGRAGETYAAFYSRVRISGEATKRGAEREREISAVARRESGALEEPSSSLPSADVIVCRRIVLRLQKGARIRVTHARGRARRHRSYAPCLLRRSNVAPRNCSQTVPRDANFLAAL